MEICYNEYDLVPNSTLVLDLHEVQLQMFSEITSCYRKKTQIQSWSIAIQIQIQIYKDKNSKENLVYS